MSQRTRHQARPQRQELAPARLDSPAPEHLLLESIAAGDLDDHLTAVADAVEARRHLLHTVRSATALGQLCVGDVVRINEKVSPKYLHGHQGRVVAIDDRCATVDLPYPVGRFRGGEVRCPPLALDRVGRAG